MEDNRTITSERNGHISWSQQREREHGKKSRPGERTTNPRRDWEPRVWMGDKHRQLIRDHLHDQGISSWVGSWDSDQTLISPSRNVFQMYTASELVTSNGTSPVSNACPPLMSNNSIFRVAKLLRDGESARQTAANSAEGTVNRTRSAAAVGRSELTGRVVVPC